MYNIFHILAKEKKDNIMELIQELKKIIVELTVETGLPVSEVFQIAVQVQRNRILEDSLKENKLSEETPIRRKFKILED